MFGWIRNKVANFTDLDSCITYLEYEVDSAASLSAIKSIAFAMYMGILRINNEGITATQFGNIYKEIKDDVMFKNSLRNCKDKDFATSYLIMAFFHSMDFADTENGKSAMAKIFHFVGRCNEESVQGTLKKVYGLLGA